MTLRAMLLVGLMLLGGGAALLLPDAPAAGAQIPPLTSGNWDVTGNETYDGGTGLVDGNITVKANATLRLTNLTLTFNTSALPPGWQMRLLVEDGGTLVMSNVIVNSTQTARAFGLFFD